MDKILLKFDSNKIIKVVIDLINNRVVQNVKSSVLLVDNKMLCCRGTMRFVLSLVTSDVTFERTQGHWYSCHLIGYT